MELKKLVLATAVFGALGGLYGCSGDEKATITIEDNSTVDDNSVVNNNNTTNSGGGTEDPNEGFYDDENALAASLGAISGSSVKTVSILNPATDEVVLRDAVQLPATILDDVTLDADVLYYLDDRVTVGNGNQEMSAVDGVLESGDDVTSATITIEAGTQILAAKGTFANLLITRGSKIMANGTADAPIVFSSDDTGYDGSGEWGGLIIHGYGLHNECEYVGVGPTPPAADVACNVDAEGESGLAGGHDNTDDSGVLNYVVVTEGGFEFAVGNEINGISMVGVGSGTEIDYVQVNNNADDGVEFFGGAVSAKHLVLTGNQDESIDWDEGWSGSIQYALVIQNENSDHGIEADTEGSTTFLSAPTLMNLTFLAAGDGAEQLARMKASTGGFIFNSVFDTVTGDPIEVCVRMEGTGVENNATSGALDFTNIVHNCTEFAQLDGVTSALLDDASISAVTSTLVDTSTYASAAAEATGLTAVDLTAYAAEHPDNQADPAFFDATTYSGAVEPGAATLWWFGWTLEDSL